MVEVSELVEIIKQGGKEILLPAFGKVTAQTKADGSLVTQADLDMNCYVEGRLKAEWPHILFLSEEMSAQDHKALLETKQPLWIFDPLDGTTNFANAIPIFSVSLALVEDGKVSFGIVYDPIRDECFTAEAGKKSQLNGEEILKPSTPSKLQDTVAIIDFKRLSDSLASKIVKKIPYTSQRSFGSGALDWCWLAIGRGHIYLHGRQNVWDYIAGQMILQQAHGKACSLEGESVFNGQFKANSVVAATTTELFEQWRNWINT